MSNKIFNSLLVSLQLFLLASNGCDDSATVLGKSKKYWERRLSDPAPKLRFKALCDMAPLFGLKKPNIEIEEAATMIRPCLNDSDPDVRSRAASSLLVIQPDAPTLVPIFVDFLRHNADVTDRVGAIISLSLLKSPEAIPGFKIGLSDGDPRVREQAIRGFERCGAYFSEARSHLMAALQDSDGTVRYEATWAVSHYLSSCDSEVIAVLEKLLNDPNPKTHSHVVTLLRERMR